MIVLGLDQAPRGIGWAYGEPGSVPARGWRENPDYDDNEELLLDDITDWLVTFVRAHKIERIYYEQIIVRTTRVNTKTTYKQFAVWSAIMCAARELGMPRHHCRITFISDWRAEFHHGMRPQRGHDGSESDAWKAMAVKECARRGWWTDDHNAAEACGIWDYGCKCEDKVYRARSKVATRRAEHAADEARREALAI